MSEDNNVCSQIFSAKRGEGKNITILTLGTKESTWTEANIWLSTGTTIATHRVTHRCRNRVRKSGKHDKPHEVYKTSASVARTGIKHLRQLRGSTIHLKSLPRILRLILDHLEMLLAAELSCRNKGMRGLYSSQQPPITGI